MKTLLISFVITLSYIAFSQNNSSVAPNILFTQNEFYDESDLTGIWEINEYWIDSGRQIRQVIFGLFGNITFSPSLEIENSEKYFGHYEVFSDTVKIKFYKKSIFEFYEFIILGDKLYLKKIDTYVDDDYLLNNDLEENIWIRVSN